MSENVQILDLDEYKKEHDNYAGTVEFRRGSIDIEFESYLVDPHYVADAVEMMEEARSSEWVPVIAALEVKEENADVRAQKTLVFVNENKSELVAIAPRTPMDWEGGDV